MLTKVLVTNYILGKNPFIPQFIHKQGCFCIPLSIPVKRVSVKCSLYILPWNFERNSGREIPDFYFSIRSLSRLEIQEPRE